MGTNAWSRHLHCQDTMFDALPPYLQELILLWTIRCPIT